MLKSSLLNLWSSHIAIDAMLHRAQRHPTLLHPGSALHPDPVGASGEGLCLPVPQLLSCPGNSALKSKAGC